MPNDLQPIVDTLAAAVDALSFSDPVTHVYNPLVYARRAHLEYLGRYASSPKEIVLLGMNPGPWGMAQTGVPFGEIESVRDWMGIETPVGRPGSEHPKRPILGFACPRSEVSGRRLWGWARDRFGDPATFFARFTVANYCPLAFMAESGRNVTPDRLPARQLPSRGSICASAGPSIRRPPARRRTVGGRPGSSGIWALWGSLSKAPTDRRRQPFRVVQKAAF